MSEISSELEKYAKNTTKSYKMVHLKFSDMEIRFDSLEKLSSFLTTLE